MSKVHIYQINTYILLKAGIYLLSKSQLFRDFWNQNLPSKSWKMHCMYPTSFTAQTKAKQASVRGSRVRQTWKVLYNSHDNKIQKESAKNSNNSRWHTVLWRELLEKDTEKSEIKSKMGDSQLWGVHHGAQWIAYYELLTELGWQPRSA
jgi:hypothetical protein